MSGIICAVGYPLNARPSISRKVDGPLLVMRNGECHFLTWRERISYFFGRTDAAKLEAKYRPHLAESPKDAALRECLGAIWELYPWESRAQFNADPAVKSARAALSQVSVPA